MTQYISQNTSCGEHGPENKVVKPVGKKTKEFARGKKPLITKLFRFLLILDA